jgi:hypothetical protein
MGWGESEFADERLPAVRRPQRPIPRGGSVYGRRRRGGDRRLGGSAWAQAAAGPRTPARPRRTGRWPRARGDGDGGGDVHLDGLGVGVLRPGFRLWPHSAVAQCQSSVQVSKCRRGISKAGQIAFCMWEWSCHVLGIEKS